VRRKYTEGEIDAYAAYCEEIDRCFFMPHNEFVGRTQIQLRLSGTNNTKNLASIGPPILISPLNCATNKGP
jgi:hypothetical protein